MVAAYSEFQEEGFFLESDTERDPRELRTARPGWRLNSLAAGSAALLLLVGVFAFGTFQATPPAETAESVIKFFTNDSLPSDDIVVETTKAPTTAAPTTTQTQEPCGDPEDGDTCHKNVMWAKTTGVVTHPEWYSGLTAESDFKSFQLRLHQQGLGGCHRPCGLTCEDPFPGSKCHNAVVWAMRHGIFEHKEWYNNLNQHSTFKDFQTVLNDEGREDCPKPCESQKHNKPSLFCFALMMPTGYEPQMIAHQLRSGVGMFGCDAFAVYSNTTVKVPPGDVVETMQITAIPIGGTLEVPIGGKYQVRLNKDIFARVWNSIVKDGRPWYHDWTVKIDIDAVFLPERLRGILRTLQPPNGLAGADGGDLVFLKNCHYTLYGAIEVLSRGALWALHQRGDQVCSTGAAGAAKVEDRYINECLKQLGARKVEAYNVLNDAHCHDPALNSPFPCYSGEASFHPFKDWDSWVNCYNQANR